MNDLENHIDEICKKYDTSINPGICVGIIRNGEFIFNKGYGLANLEYDIPITGDSVFHCASMAKQFTGMCTALLIEDRKIACADHIRHYFPELPSCMDEVNISHLVHMTNGIYDIYGTAGFIYGIRENDFITEDEMWNFVKASDWLMFQPGEKWSYGNTGYFLLAQLVKRVTGMSISEYAAKNIFNPLKMNNTFLRDDRSKIIKNRAVGYSQYSHVHYNDYTQTYTTKGDDLSINEDIVDVPGAGQLWTTVNELLYWDRNFYANSLGNGNQSLIDTITTPGILNNGESTHYGYGLWSYAKDCFEHVMHGGWAGGYSSYVDRIMDKNLSVIILGNHTDIFEEIEVHSDSIGIIDKIVHHILHNSAPKLTPVHEHKKSGINMKSCIDISGKYQCESNSFLWEITEIDGGFSICQNYGEVYTVYSDGDNTFASDDNMTIVVDQKNDLVHSLCATINSQEYMFLPYIKNVCDSDLLEYVGIYRNMALNLTFNVSVRSGMLRVENANRHNTAVDLDYTPTIKDSFMTNSPPYITYYCITFQRNEDGKIISFAYRDDEETKRENFVLISYKGEPDGSPMISPAIHLPGNCAEAIALYQKAFDVTVNSIVYYRDAPPDSGMSVSEDEQNRVMHAELTICGSRVNMSDINPDEIIIGNLILLNVFLDSCDDVSKAFHVLKEGGIIQVDLGPQFFSSMYGSVEDRFGVRWQLIS